MMHDGAQRSHGSAGYDAERRYIQASIIMAHPPDRLAHEENILYLMIALDEALARKEPQWAPEQVDAVSQRLASLVRRLLAIIPRSPGSE